MLPLGLTCSRDRESAKLIAPRETTIVFTSCVQHHLRYFFFNLDVTIYFRSSNQAVTCAILYAKFMVAGS